MRAQAVQHLLMGGQACVLYGAAEFSRDADLAIVAEPENLERLRRAFDQLDARVIAVPPFEAAYLERGHAVHVQCGRDDVRGLHIDVMARMRGVDPFPALWARRTTVELAADPDETTGALTIDVLSLPDLVAAKKTQRDKDWPMIRRLVETNYLAFREQATASRVQFWLRELRTVELLLECATAFPSEAASLAGLRPAVGAALAKDQAPIEAALAAEQAAERERDRAYWAPLRAELEHLRRSAGHHPPR